MTTAAYPTANGSSDEEGMPVGVATHWPHPPDVQHAAKQLAGEALQKASLLNTEYVHI